jgi:hypothetical protein
MRVLTVITKPERYLMFCNETELGEFRRKNNKWVFDASPSASNPYTFEDRWFDEEVLQMILDKLKELNSIQ